MAHRFADASLPAPIATENAAKPADSKFRQILKLITLKQYIDLSISYHSLNAGISLCCATVHNPSLQLPEVGEIEQDSEFIHLNII